MRDHLTFRAGDSTRKSAHHYNTIEGCTIIEGKLRGENTMKGVFNTSGKEIQKNRFLCVWTGIMIKDRDRDLKMLVNAFDTSRYGIAVNGYYICPPLDENGNPLCERIKENEYKTIQGNEQHSMAVFLNEPSDSETYYVENIDDMWRVNKREGSTDANVCMLPLRGFCGQFSIILLVAQRDIPSGEELTLVYSEECSNDRNAFIRKHFDFYNDFLAVRIEEYNVKQGSTQRCTGISIPPPPTWTRRERGTSFIKENEVAKNGVEAWKKEINPLALTDPVRPTTFLIGQNDEYAARRTTLYAIFQNNREYTSFRIPMWQERDPYLAVHSLRIEDNTYHDLQSTEDFVTRATDTLRNEGYTVIRQRNDLTTYAVTFLDPSEMHLTDQHKTVLKHIKIEYDEDNITANLGTLITTEVNTLYETDVGAGDWYRKTVTYKNWLVYTTFNGVPATIKLYSFIVKLIVNTDQRNPFRIPSTDEIEEPIPVYKILLRIMDWVKNQAIQKLKLEDIVRVNGETKNTWNTGKSAKTLSFLNNVFDAVNRLQESIEFLRDLMKRRHSSLKRQRDESHSQINAHSAQFYMKLLDICETYQKDFILFNERVQQSSQLEDLLVMYDNLPPLSTSNIMGELEEHSYIHRLWIEKVCTLTGESISTDENPRQPLLPSIWKRVLQENRIVYEHTGTGQIVNDYKKVWTIQTEMWDELKKYDDVEDEEELSEGGRPFL